jgi:predicted transcriptional regulator
MKIDLTPEEKKRLEQLAADAACSPEELARSAVGDFLVRMQALDAKPFAGEARMENDDWLTNDEVFRRLDRRWSSA